MAGAIPLRSRVEKNLIGWGSIKSRTRRVWYEPCELSDEQQRTDRCQHHVWVLTSGLNVSPGRRAVKVTKITVRYRVVTPLFCGGANPRDSAELRLASFKGVLRFWWRALAWARYGGDLKEVQSAEDELFGSGGGQARRSRVVMRLATVSGYEQRCESEVLKDSRGVVGHGARYLGYGLMDAFGATAGKLRRACMVAKDSTTPFEFEVQLRCNAVPEEDLFLLQNALGLMGTVGGLGARSRKGYGSIALSAMSDGIGSWKPPTSIKELANRIKTLVTRDCPESRPPYTAFSKGSRFVLLDLGDVDRPAGDALVLLDRVGRELIRYRSHGQRGRILGSEPSERNFPTDHDVMEAVALRRGGRPRSHPRRVAFGLPHNYFFSSNPDGLRKAEVTPQDHDRRASPLFIHIHTCGDSPIAILSFLPALFLPNDRPTLKIGWPRSTTQYSVPLVPEAQLYTVIDDFLTRLSTGTGRKEPFGSTLEVP